MQNSSEQIVQTRNSRFESSCSVFLQIEHLWNGNSWAKAVSWEALLLERINNAFCTICGQKNNTKLSTDTSAASFEDQKPNRMLTEMPIQVNIARYLTLTGNIKNK